MESKTSKADAVLHYSTQAALAKTLAEQAAAMHTVIDRAASLPYVITIRAPDADNAWHCVAMQVVESAPGAIPDPLQLVPPGVDEFSVDMLPASRFEGMPVAIRQRYATQYRAYLMWRKARAIGKALKDMKPWVDHDPIDDDERVQRWLKPIGRYCGD